MKLLIFSVLATLNTIAYADYNPFQIAYAAYWGNLPGIDGYAKFCQNHNSIYEGEDIVLAAVEDGKVASDRLEDERFIITVKRHADGICGNSN